MPHNTAQPEQHQAAVRDSASEQPEAIIKSKHKLKALMADSISTVQVHGLTAVSGRQAVKGDLAVESFKCQLWKPATSVPELEPGKEYFQHCGVVSVSVHNTVNSLDHDCISHQENCASSEA